MFRRYRYRKRGLSIGCSYYCASFLGSKEVFELRRSSLIASAALDIVSGTQRQQARQVTIKLCDKGLKTIQSVPTLTRNRRLKYALIKYRVPHYSISYAGILPPPNHDCVAVVMLLFNQDVECPMQCQVYRLESLAAAQEFRHKVQILINRPENAQRFFELEHRLVKRGLLSSDVLSSTPKLHANNFPQQRPTRSTSTNQIHNPVVSGDPKSPSYESLIFPANKNKKNGEIARLQNAVAQELKTKLRTAEVDSKNSSYDMNTWKKVRKGLVGEMAKPSQFRQNAGVRVHVNKLFDKNQQQRSNNDDTSSGIASADSSSSKGMANNARQQVKARQRVFGGMEDSQGLSRSRYSIAAPELAAQSMYAPANHYEQKHKNSTADLFMKASRFFSMEDMNLQNRSLAASQEALRDSLWHLPCLIDPFGKQIEQLSSRDNRRHSQYLDNMSLF